MEVENSSNAVTAWHSGTDNAFMDSPRKELVLKPTHELPEKAKG